MGTLFNVKFNWGVYFLLLFGILILWPGLSVWSVLALAVTLHQFMLVFYAMGSAIPIRYLAGALLSLQMLLGPTLAFNGLDAFQTNAIYRMQVSEETYFSYVLPAVVLFIIGLHVTAGKLKGEVLDKKGIEEFADHSGNLAYIFIGVGFFASFLAGSFGSELAFVFYLLSSFKFIGAFLIILSTKKTKTWVLVLVFGSIIVSTLREAMFHDLLTWLMMLGAVVSFKYKPSVAVKLAATASFILLAVIIQQVKGTYRESAWGGKNGGGGIESFENAVDEHQENNSLFSTESLAKSNIRINQGFIVTHIMNNVPSKVDFEDGKELLQILEAAFLPRILAPNKLNAGDRTIFMQYTGLQLRKGTSMALSSVGDAYINFGTLGGPILMFGLGLLFSEVLNGFQRFSKFYPFLLLFTPLVFYYPIRADCELQTSLGHLVKACFLIYVMLLFWKKDFVKIRDSKKKAFAVNLADSNV